MCCEVYQQVNTIYFTVLTYLFIPKCIFLSINKTQVKDTEQMKELYKGWRRGLRKKFKDCRSTGGAGEVTITASEEMMYSLLQGNKSLVGGYKVCIFGSQP